MVHALYANAFFISCCFHAIESAVSTVYRILLYLLFTRCKHGRLISSGVVNSSDDTESQFLHHILHLSCHWLLYAMSRKRYRK